MALLLNLLELASNAGLQYDAESRERLLKLEGKTLLLEVTTLNQSVCLSPQKDGLELSEHIPDGIDVTLKASIPALVKLSRDGIDNVELEPGELEIIGDPIIGQRFAHLLSKVSIDWEDILIERLGPKPARFISSSLVQAREVAEVGHLHLKQVTRDIIHEELDLVANAIDAERFSDRVEDLVVSVEDLEKRITTLMQRLEQESNS